MRLLRVEQDALFDAAIDARIPLSNEFVIPQALKARVRYRALTAVTVVSLALLCADVVGFLIWFPRTLGNVWMGALALLALPVLFGAGVLSGRAYARCRRLLTVLGQLG